MSKHANDPSPLHTATIAADRMIRAPLGQVISAIVVLAGAVYWATSLWRDVQDLKRDMSEVKAAVRELVPSHPSVSSNP